MTNPTHNDLDAFLDSPASAPATRCICCKNPELVADLNRIADGKEDGSISISIHKIWADYIRPKYGVKAVNSVYRHLRVCEGRDI